MANYFDKYDDQSAPAAPPPAGGNYFDKYDDAPSLAGFNLAAPATYDRFKEDELNPFLYSAADSLSLGFGDEIHGALAGLSAASSGGDYISTYRQKVDEARARLEEARRLHPLASLAGAAAGAIPLALATGGAGEAVAARAGLGWLSRAAALPEMALYDIRPAAAKAVLGGIGGAIGGGIYGAGSGDGDFGERLDAAKNNALLGGGLGLVSPMLVGGLGAKSAFVRAPAGAVIGGAGALMAGQDPFQGAALGAGVGVGGRPAIQALKRVPGAIVSALEHIPTPNPNQTNSLLGGFENTRPPAPPAAPTPQPPRIPDEVVTEIERALARERYGVDEFARRVADAESRPLGRTMADVGGQQFLARADMFAQSPGESGPIAAAISERRAGAFGRQITEDLRAKLGVDKSPTQALTDLAEQTRTASDGYEEVLSRPPNQKIVAEKIAPLMRVDKRFQDALRRRFDIENTQTQIAALDNMPAPARSVARMPDGSYELLPSATGRALHGLKTNLDDAFEADANMRDLSSSGKGEKIELLDPLRKRFLALMDQAISGYGPVRAQRGGIFEATKALEEGKKLLSHTGEEIEQIMAEVGPFERKYLQIGAADDIRTRVMKAATDETDTSGRLRNAANPIINPEMKSRIRAIFDDPEKADEFIRTLNERDRLFRNSAKWVSGADTYRRGAQAADSGVGQLADMGAKAILGNPTGAALDGGKIGWNALLGRYFEGRNNKVGNAFLSEIDSGTPEQRAYNAELVRILRERERVRVSEAVRSAHNGAMNAIGGGAIRDQQEGY